MRQTFPDLLPLLLLGTLHASTLDTISFGDPASESAHTLTAELSQAIPGALSEPSRQLLPGGSDPWRGGTLRFTAKVDPVRQNYFTLRLWGGDVNHNQLTLHVEGKQIGYRHLGDIEALDIGTDAPAYPGRFTYRTCPLPLPLTTGKQSITCEIRATGPIWGYGRNFEEYQKPITEPTRSLYRAYTHTDGFFQPDPAEKQAPPPPPVVRQSPGPEVVDAIKARVNGEIDRLLRHPDQPASQMQTLFLAKAWRTKWTRAAGKPEVFAKILLSLDHLYRSYVADPKLAQAEPSTYNPDWFGLGPAGQVIQLLEKELAPHLDQAIDDGSGKQVKRREGFRAMLLACRDWHRENRRQYTNQSMINDLYGIYLANRGLAVVAPADALPEKQALRYLYESVGLEPWLGSEKDGKPLKPLGESYYQLTAKGLTKELGFVGNYGEVLDWATQIYEATRPAPDKDGDKRLKEQLVKIARARAPFRYPLQDREGFRAMVQETPVGWRDVHYPGDVTYSQRPSWDGSPVEAAAATLDPQLVGGVQQMIEDRQLYATLKDAVKGKGFRTSAGLLAIPDHLEIVLARPASPQRLPMSPGQPDFVFSDEEDGVIAVKNGDEILYASLYWRARHALNSLARVHYLTPRIDRIATVYQQVEFTPSGMEYTRPDWTNFGFANGGHRYPKEFISAHTGEKLPIARIPEGIAFKPGLENIHAGRGDFYRLDYGPYRIAMNMSADQTFDYQAPATGKIRNLSNGKDVKPGTTAKLAPRSTIVLHCE